jgi:outer membrane protein assembly factor BamB
MPLPCEGTLKRTCCLLLLLLMVASFGTRARAESPAMFRADARHSGAYAGPGVPTLHGVKWKFHTGGAVFSSPAIANGVLYVGSADHNLYALDATTGAVKWKFETQSRVQSSPAVSESAVYFGSYDGNFYAVDAATGKVKWQFKTGGERRFTATHLHGALPAHEAMPDPFDVFLSSPALANGAVYFGSGDGNVYSLDAASGKLNWKFATGDVVHASPAIADGTEFVGSWDSYFYALDAATGKEKWRFKTGEDADIHNQVGIQSSAAVLDGTLYFGCRDSNFYALDAATGKQKWAFNNKGSWVVGSPAVREGKVYFATSDSGMLYAMDAKSGAKQGSWESKKWPMFSSPALAAGTLYIGSDAGKLIAIDLAAQKVVWTFESDGAKQNSAAYTKPDGTPNYEAAFFDFFYDDMVAGVQRMRAMGGFASSPVLDGGTLYVGSTDGTVYALQ